LHEVYTTPQERKVEEDEILEEYNFKDAYKTYHEFFAKEKDFVEQSSFNLFAFTSTLLGSILLFVLWRQRKISNIRRRREEKKEERLKKEKEFEEKAKISRERQLERAKEKEFIPQKWNEIEEETEIEIIQKDIKSKEVEMKNCYICNKVFKSDSQLKNHEQSNKHQQLSRELKKFTGNKIIEDSKQEENLESIIISKEKKNQKKSNKILRKQKKLQDLYFDQLDLNPVPTMTLND